jgi:hypothetical protein
VHEEAKKGFVVAVEKQGKFPYITVAHLLHCQFVFHSLGITPGLGKGYRNLAADERGFSRIRHGWYGDLVDELGVAVELRGDIPVWIHGPGAIPVTSELVCDLAEEDYGEPGTKTGS